MLSDSSKLGANCPQWIRSDDWVRSVRSRRMIRLPVNAVLGIFWSVMMVKCGMLSWAIAHWQMPISHAFVWIGSLVGISFITVVYKSRLFS